MLQIPPAKFGAGRGAISYGTLKPDQIGSGSAISERLERLRPR